MGLMADDRGRVPFALVGVVLLVGSTAFAASVHTGPAGTADPATERALERVRAEAAGALRAAARTGAKRAMLTPVAVPANTSAGRALENPFRDALALRVRRQLERRLARTSVSPGDVVGTARLAGAPAIEDRVESIRLRRAGTNGSAMRVETTVVLEARRGSTVVDRVRLPLSVVVGTPVLAVHDRVQRFERALDAGPTEFGLARQVTAQLYAVAWARGYAQYGGGPVANVIATRHVELTTNRGLLSLQRETVGCPADGAVSALGLAAARTAATDLGVATGVTDEVAAFGSHTGASSPRVTPEDGLKVGVGRQADRGLLAVRRNLSRLLNRTYSAEVRLAATVSRVSTSGPTGAPGSDWTLVEEDVAVSVGPGPGAGEVTGSPGSHRLRSYDRRVERRVVREWTRGDTHRTTTRRTVHRVTVAVLGHHAPSNHAPRRGIRRVHEPGGPLDGPNLDGIERRAVDALVEGRGGADGLARRAVAGTLQTGGVRVRGRRPADLRDWVTADLLDLHARVAALTVSPARGDVGTYRANPPAMLAAKIESRRPDLLDAHGTYPSVASKARTAARAAYLDRVVAALERRADRRRSTREDLDGALERVGQSLSQLAAGMDARRNTSVRDCQPVADRIAGVRPVVVDATPAYLTTGTVDRRRVGLRGAGRFHPLATRNRNLVTIPKQEVVQGIVSALLGTEKTVPLRTAASALRAAEGFETSNVSNRTLRRRRMMLRSAVANGVDASRERMLTELRRAGVGSDSDQRRAILTDALGRWNTTAGRALALARGNATDAVVAAALARDPSMDDDGAALLRSRLRVAVGEVLRSGAARPPRGVVATAARTTRAVGRVALETGLEAGVDRTAGRRIRKRLGAIPAGLPVAPVPGYWYATTNLWTVEAEGRYERFVVRVRQGGPAGPLRYVRDGATASFDADGDGEPERVGRATRIDFRVATGVVVIVPPGARGVGDVDGDRDELSPGWER